MNNKRTTDKEFGAAKDYYRVRLLKMEEQLPDDLEWREDILYAAPKIYPGKLKLTYRLLVITYKNDIYELAYLKDKKDASNRYKKMRKDLAEKTKREFDAIYKLDEYIKREQRTGEEPESILKEPIAKDSIIFTGTRRLEKDESQ